jgi:tRNA(adenine34) deaminase
MTADDDRFYMEMALELAAEAAVAGEVPVGAVVVRDGAVIGRGWNRPISTCDATAHAEIVALRDASLVCGNYRLPDATLYVTIEPCTMCVGAMIHARIRRVVFGTPEPKAGALVSQLRLAEAGHWNHRLEVDGDVCAEEAAETMRRFFQQRREQARANKAAPE